MEFWFVRPESKQFLLFHHKSTNRNFGILQNPRGKLDALRFDLRSAEGGAYGRAVDANTSKTDACHSIFPICKLKKPYRKKWSFRETRKRHGNSRRVN